VDPAEVGRRNNDLSAGDPLGLQRFVRAQDPIIEQVLAELSAGQKRTHWMWFIFPQLRGLGRSATAQFYAIGSLEEARAYLDHAVLGPRLIECTERVNALQGRTLLEIFGTPDDLKFHSCMSLFAEVPDAPAVFTQALAKYFEGARDERTLVALGRAGSGAGPGAVEG
jgi:uncharacterized protein (DUF1810 family)